MSPCDTVDRRVRTGGQVIPLSHRCIPLYGANHGINASACWRLGCAMPLRIDPLLSGERGGTAHDGSPAKS